MLKIREFGLLVAITSSLSLFACGPQGPEPKSADATQEDAPPTPPGGPEGAKAGEHRAPPEEAFTACDGKQENDACSVKRDNEKVAGTCKQGPKDATETRLACMPQGGHKGGPGGPPPSGDKPSQ
jgi:hypothetical protein